MTPALTPNAQAILLLTAPLIAGRGGDSTELLSLGEYKRLARHLWEIQRQPADLLSPDASEILRACGSVLDENRLRGLLGRGFLLSQVLEYWRARAIWVVSRADAAYPRRIKARLRDDAPAILYGCGDMRVLDQGGLAVVGSRHVDDSLIDFTMEIGRLTARARRTVVSGGARGVDQAAMRGALEAGGHVVGVLADSLEKTAMNREHRNLLLNGQLAAISPYDPKAGFNVGHAMQRNKLIYALADASLVVSSDLNKGGTWSGAVEQLDKYRFAPLYVRATGRPSPGVPALLSKGALPWPDPQDVDAYERIFEAPPPTPEAPAQASLALVSDGAPHRAAPAATSAEPPPKIAPPTSQTASGGLEEGAGSPAEILFAAARAAILSLLTEPMKDAEVAAALNIAPAQAKAWLQRLLDEGLLEKRKKPAGYAVVSPAASA